jgi:branched-chain amino acid transport system permease protein
VAMVWLDELIWRQFPRLNLLILGVATIVLVLFLPRGIVGTLLRRKPQWRRYVP